MAVYKKPCIHCGTLIDGDSRVCISCQSMSPFGYLCPTCSRPIEKGQSVCAGCGRALYVVCPKCGGQTFVEERCEKCGFWLMVRCENKRCGAWQFFENDKCSSCGKKMKKKTGR